MFLSRAGLAAGLSLVAAGCAPPQPTPDNRSVDIDAAAEAARNDIARYAARPAAASARPTPGERVAAPPPGTPGGLPDDRTPIAEGRFAPDSAQAAADVVQTYYALIEAGRYREAWALWDDGGKASGVGNADAFAARFASYADYHANVGAPGRVDAGAGQRYVEVPVVLYGRRKDGTPFHQDGTMVLHRTADIDGASRTNQRWHLHSATVEPIKTRND